MTKLLTCGLGGGLDIVNASLLYFAAKNEGTSVVLGSSRPAPLESIENHAPFANSGTWINKDSVIHYGRKSYRGKKTPPRYPEPRIASLLEENILFLSRKYQGKDDLPRLRHSIHAVQHQYHFSHLLFVDGGGDSLILTKDEAIEDSEYRSDPFAGGDAQMLEALRGIENAYLAVIAVGLDVSEEGFQRNVQLLQQQNAYYGRVNLKTGEQEEYKLGNIIQWKNGFLGPYFNLTEKVLALTESDLADPRKTMSHTAVVAYHALQGNYGIQRTFVPWEPRIDGDKEGKKGVLVKPEHGWMYFFDAARIHTLKIELNTAKSTKN